MPRIRVMTLGALLGMGLPSPASSQPAPPGAPTPRAEARLLLLQPRFGDPTLSELWRSTQAVGAATPVAPTLLSLAIPGVGQHVLGQRRKWIYAAVEVVGWVVFLERRNAGAEYRDRYRDHAWQEGRIQAGTRVDGDFDYYETMSEWARSGLFDADAGAAGVQPEMDSTTYNGSIWALASQIYLPGGGPVPVTDPAYQGALAYYGERAYGTAYLWDWSGAPGGMQRLADLIEESDSRYRQATTALGAVIANHLVSAADAYLSSRGLAPPARVSVVPNRTPWGGSWSAVVTVPLDW